MLFDTKTWGDLVIHTVYWMLDWMPPSCFSELWPPPASYCILAAVEIIDEIDILINGISYRIRQYEAN